MEISLSERPFAFFQKGQMCRIYRQLWKVNDMADMVKVEHLKKNFGDLEVLKDINLGQSKVAPLLSAQVSKRRWSILC